MNISLPFSSRYQLISSIGHGGMGEVSKAWDKAINREVAVKIIHSDTGSDPRMRQCFYQEARAFALLKHPHILKLYDYGITDSGQLYIAMELIHGCSLHALKSAKLSLHNIIDLLSQILDALSLAHARGLIHLDIKTENVLVSMIDGKIWTKIADFGLSSLPSDSLDPCSTGFGTPAYMAPEQILSQYALIGPCSDIYATGILLYEFLSGHLPFDEMTSFQTLKAQISAPIPCIHWQAHFNNIPQKTKDELSNIVFRALDKKPWQRFISAKEFRQALLELQLPDEPEYDDEIIQQLKLNSHNGDSDSDIIHIADDINDKIRAVKAVQDSGLLSPPDKRAPQINYIDPNELSESLDAFARGILNPNAMDTERTAIEPARKKELSTLKKDADRALNANGIQRIISGGFGIGKTKLIRFLADNYLQNKFTPIVCTSLKYNAITNKQLTPNEISSNLFISFIQQLITILKNKNTTQTEDSLADQYVSIFDKLKSDATTAVTTLDTSFWNEATEFITRLLPLAANLTPISILIDNLQHNNIAVYRLFDRINTLVGHLPILSLITYDPNELAIPAEIAHLAEMPCFHNLFANQIKLGPLPHTTLVQMLKFCCRLDDNLSMRIANASFGNPYYATALVKHLNQSSRLQVTHNGHFGLSPNDTFPLGVPKVVTKFFQKKLDEIALEMGTESEFYREILIRIAAFGAQMTMAELQAFWKIDNDNALADCWREAIAAWSERRMLILNQTETTPGNTITTLTFTEPWHADIIIAKLPSRRSRALKAQAAMALIECYDKPDYNQSWRIAQLWAEAKDITSYLQACQQSAGNATDQSELKFAFARYENLADFFDEIFTSPTINSDLVKAIDWPSCLIQGAEIAIFFDNSLAFDKYIARLKLWSDSFEQTIYLAHIQKLNAKFQFRKLNLQRASEIANMAKDSFEICNDFIETARTLVIMADIQFLMDNPRNARQMLQAALETFNQNHLETDAASTIIRIAKLEWHSGAICQAISMAKEAIDIFDRNQATTDKNNATFLLLFLEYLNTPTTNTFEAISHLAEVISKQGDDATTAHVRALTLIVAVLSLNWQTVHSLQQITPSKTADGAILAGTQSCVKAIEMTLNAEHFDADNEITTAIACFGPQNRRARAWCHALLGIHAAITQQLRQGVQSFDRAKNDFQLLDDHLGTTTVLVGQALLAVSCGQYDDAFSIALDAIQAANQNYLAVHSTLAIAIAAKACFYSEQFDKFGLAKAELPYVLPEFFKQIWISSMDSLLNDCNKSNIPLAFTKKIQAIRNVFNTQNTRPNIAISETPSSVYESLPSVEMTI